MVHPPFRYRLLQGALSILVAFLVSAVIGLALLPTPARAEPVQLLHEGLHLNGNLIETNAQTDPGQKTIYLILHGTWAHLGMEIIQDMQALLEEQGASSLAISLSLGLDNRSGFLSCDQTIQAQHGNAMEELRAWRDWLVEQGWKRIILVGHSRGGNQVSLYQRAYQDPLVMELDLLAPMVWQESRVQADYQKATGYPLKPLLELAREFPDKVFTAPRVNHCDSVPVTGHSFLSYYAATPQKDTPSVLKDIQRPVYVYLGGKDPISRRFAQEYAQNPPLKQVNLLTIEGADHFFRDFYLDEVVEDMLQRHSTYLSDATSLIPQAENLQQDARTAQRRGIPILLYVTLPDCHFCAKLEQKVLLPMLRSGDYQDRVLLREVNWESKQPLIDFSGDSVVPEILLQAYDIAVTPTLVFVGPDGKALAKPLVGYNGSDFYEYYLNKTLKWSTQAVHTAD